MAQAQVMPLSEFKKKRKRKELKTVKRDGNEGKSSQQRFVDLVLTPVQTSKHGKLRFKSTETHKTAE